MSSSAEIVGMSPTISITKHRHELKFSKVRLLHFVFELYRQEMSRCKCLLGQLDPPIALSSNFYKSLLQMHLKRGKAHSHQPGPLMSHGTHTFHKLHQDFNDTRRLVLAWTHALWLLYVFSASKLLNCRQLEFLMESRLFFVILT